MQKENIYKSLKIIVYLVGLPLMSLLIFLAFIPMYNISYISNIAIIWSVITLGTWILILIIHYIISVTSSRRSPLVRDIGNLIIPIMAVIIVLLPSTIYGYVNKKNYNKIVATASSQGIKLDSYEDLLGQYRNFTKGTTNAIDNLDSSVNQFILDYKLLGFDSEHIGTVENNQAGVGYFPGLYEKTSSELTRHSIAQKALNSAISQRQEKTVELDQIMRTIQIGNSNPIEISLAALRTKTDETQALLETKQELTNKAYIALEDDYTLLNELAAILTLVDGGFASKSYKGYFTTLNNVQNVGGAINKAKEVNKDIQKLTPDAPQLESIADNSELSRLQLSMNYVLDSKDDLLKASQEWITAYTTTDIDETDLESKKQTFLGESLALHTNFERNIRSLMRVMDYVKMLNKRLNYLEKEYDSAIINSTKLKILEERKIVAQEVFNKIQPIKDWLAPNAINNSQLELLTKFGDELDVITNTYTIDTTTPQHVEWVAAKGSMKEVETLLKDYTNSYEIETTKDISQYYEFDGTPTVVVELESFVSSIIGIFDINLTEIHSTKILPADKLAMWDSLIEGLLSKIPVVGGEIVNNKLLNSLIYGLYNYLNNNIDAVGSSLGALTGAGDIVTDLLNSVLSTWEKYIGYSLTIETINDLPATGRQKLDLEGRPLFFDDNTPIIVPVERYTPEVMLFTLVMSVQNLLDSGLGGLLFSFLPTNITLETSDGLIAIAEGEMAQGYSVKELTSLQYKLNNYPNILAYANYRHFSYLFSTIIFASLLAYCFFNNKEKQERKKSLSKEVDYE